MTRYFFHLQECGVVILDEEGMELADEATARDVAIKAARSVMAGEVQAGRLCLSCCIEVADAARNPVLRVPFRQALAITGL